LNSESRNPEPFETRIDISWIFRRFPAETGKRDSRISKRDSRFARRQASGTPKIRRRGGGRRFESRVRHDGTRRRARSAFDETPIRGGRRPARDRHARSVLRLPAWRHVGGPPADREGGQRPVEGDHLDATVSEPISGTGIGRLSSARSETLWNGRLGTGPISSKFESNAAESESKLQEFESRISNAESRYVKLR
jgi:hypothetical protein